MNKMILKRLLFEICETLIRLENQVQLLEQSVSANRLPYVKSLKQKLATIKNALYQCRADIILLFQEAPLEEAASKKLMDVILNDIRTALAPFTQALYRIQQNTILPETELFINSLNLNKLLPNSPPITVLPALDNSDKELAGLATDSVLLEFLPLLAVDSPLHWVNLLDNFFRLFSEKTLQVTSLLESLTVPEPKSDYILPLFSLRILGPAYYAAYVMNAVEQSDAFKLLLVEPILFQELNRFGLIHKDLVILHQSLDKLKQQLSLNDSEQLTTLIEEDLGDTILKVVEKMVPERLAFNEKTLFCSQLLQERLERGQLISAIPMLTGSSQLKEDLEALEESDSIYPILHKLQETPATPREIINAGWLYKLDQASTWLVDAFLSESVQAQEEGWEQLRETVRNLDHILLKSIEISEVHRVLAHEENDVLVPA